MFIVQRLPDFCGVNLPAFECLADLSVFQDKYAVRRKRDAFQNMRRKKHSTILLISGNLLIQILCTFKIQPVYWLIQKKQLRFQCKCSN